MIHQIANHLGTGAEMHLDRVLLDIANMLVAIRWRPVQSAWTRDQAERHLANLKQFGVVPTDGLDTILKDPT